MGIKAKQLDGFNEFSDAMGEMIDTVERKIDIAANASTVDQKVNMLDLSNWNGNGALLNGVSCGSFLSPGQLNLCLSMYTVTNATGAFTGMAIEHNPLEDQLIYGSSIAGMFKNCTRLEEVRGINAPWARDVSELFNGCTNLSNVQSFDTSNANDLSLMFQGCSSLPMEFPWVIKLTSIDTEDAVYNMFKNSSVKKVTYFLPSSKAALRETITKSQIDPSGHVEMIVFIDENGVQYVSDSYGTLDGTNWWSNGADLGGDSYLSAKRGSDFGSLSMYTITGVKNMFAGASEVISVPNLIIDGSVTDMSGMFSGCTDLSAIPPLDFAQITTTESMLDGCAHITGDQSFNLPEATTIKAMLRDCRLITSATVNAPKATMADFAFVGCESAGSISALTSSAITAKSMFSGCSAATTITMTDDVEVSGDVSGMFNGCSSLESVPAITFANVTAVDNMFNSCAKISSTPAFSTTGITSFVNMFRGCGRLSNVSWLDTSSATNLDGAFAYSGVFSLANVDLTNVTSLNGTFEGCSNLITLPDLDKLKIKIKNWSRMFADCASLPTMFPYVLDMTTVTSRSDILDVIGGDCGSSEIKIAIENTGEIPSWVSTYYFGKNCRRIIVVDAADHSVILGERTHENSNEEYTTTYTNAGTYWYTVPTGVTKVRVALVSGGEYTYDDTSSSTTDEAHFTRKVCNVSSFGDITSLNSPIYADYFWNSWASIPFDKKSTGYALEWGATFSDQNKAGYGAGMWLASGGEKKNCVTMFVEPSLVDTLVDVTPGQKIRVVVGKGDVKSVGVTVNIAYVNQTPCHPQGYVMVGYGNSVIGQQD